VTGRNIALITSTVAPAAGVLLLKRTDVQERLADYVRAFDFYCRCLCRGIFDRIVYVENSGYPLDRLQGVAQRHGVSSLIEFVSYRADTPPANNRLYLELNLISHALEASSFLKDPDAVIWKITGRYIIKNVSKIVAKCSARQKDLYINCRNLPSRYTDFYFVGFRRPAFDVLFPDLDAYRGREAGEFKLRQTLDQDLPGVSVLPRFPAVPRVLGVRGWDGARYDSLRNLAKFQLRSAINFALPWLWI
jgi:hypothetical protein